MAWPAAGGTDLALLCDMVIAADDAVIGFPPARSLGAAVGASRYGFDMSTAAMRAASTCARESWAQGGERGSTNVT